MWAERERGMMRLFLEDLRHYTQQARAGAGAGDAAHYAHITELTVRLHFLTAIFSPVGSPQNFRYVVVGTSLPLAKVVMDFTKRITPERERAKGRRCVSLRRWSMRLSLVESLVRDTPRLDKQKFCLSASPMLTYRLNRFCHNP